MNCKVKGKVKDGGQPVTGATISRKMPTGGWINVGQTDANGDYILTLPVPPGQSELDLKANGNNKEKIEVRMVQAGNEYVIDFDLD